MTDIEETTVEAIEEFGNREDLLHLVGMLFPPRLGVRAFMSMLEWEHFSPKEGRNELFTMHIVSWSGVRWAMLSIPIEDRPKAEDIAGRTGVRIADGVPAVFSVEGHGMFPARGKTVFTLENTKDHAVYEHGIRDDMIEAESRFLKEYFKEKNKA